MLKSLLYKEPTKLVSFPPLPPLPPSLSKAIATEVNILLCANVGVWNEGAVFFK